MEQNNNDIFSPDAESRPKTTIDINVPTISLNNGIKMPVLGLGTGTNLSSKPGEVEAIVYEAISLGYRHFDCSPLYKTEAEVGNAIFRHIQKGTLTRRELFLTSKLFGAYNSPERVKICLEKSLNNLKTNYIDSYLMHTPCSIHHDGKRDEDGFFMPSDVDYVDTWTQMEKILHAGTVKAIGISNFNCDQIKRLLDKTNIKPVINQIESQPYWNNDELIQFCQSHQIHVTAYSAFGSPDRFGVTPEDCRPLEDPLLLSIAEKKKSSAADVIIRFCLQRGLSVIPRTVNKSRLRANFESANQRKDLLLNSDELRQIRSLNCAHGRVMDLGIYKYCQNYPFDDVDRTRIKQRRKK